MKLNRKWLLVIALVLSLTMAISGTLAYLTDRDSEANVLTFGNVEIELNEDFQQGSELIPGVDVEKKPTITNVGKNDAWVWATVAIPAALDNDDASKNVVHFNYDKDDVNENEWTWTNNGSWMVKTETIDEVQYKVYTVLYQTALKTGDTTSPVITKVYLDAHIDIDPDGNMYHVQNGVVTDLDWNVDDDGTPVMYVSAYAIQTEGFATVQDAYAAYNAQWGGKGTEYADPAEVVGTANDLFESIKAGNSAVANNSQYNVFTLTSDNNTVDAKGATVTLNGSNTQETYHGYLGFIGDNVTVSNLNVTGSGLVELGDYTQQGGTYTANNLVLKNMISTLANGDKGYTLGCTFVHYGTATLNNCTMTGATAMVEGSMPVDAGFVNGTTTTVNGGKYGTIYCWSKATATIKDAEVKKLYAAPNTGVITIGAGSHINTLTLNYTTGLTPTAARLAKLVIEEGATVDQIVFGENTYTQAEWATYVASLS